MKIIVELGGGLDICFENHKEIEIELECETIKMGLLIEHLVTKCNPKKIEFFVINKSLRPGILVLINDADWELEDKEDAII